MPVRTFIAQKTPITHIPAHDVTNLFSYVRDDYFASLAVQIHFSFRRPADHVDKNTLVTLVCPG